MPRYRVIFRGPVSRALVQWIERLIPVLRQAPPDTEVTVEVVADEDDPS